MKFEERRREEEEEEELEEEEEEEEEFSCLFRFQKTAQDAKRPILTRLRFFQSESLSFFPVCSGFREREKGKNKGQFGCFFFCFLVEKGERLYKRGGVKLISVT